MKSFETLKMINRQVNNYRFNLQRLLSDGDKYRIYVVIGGSYALKCQVDDFAGRETHDYDFIVLCPDQESMSHTIKMLNTLTYLGGAHVVGYNYSPGGSRVYTVGSVIGCKADIIVKHCENPEGEISLGIYHDPFTIMKAKLTYIRRAINNNNYVRNKDIQDLKTFYGDGPTNPSKPLINGLGRKELNTITHIAKFLPNTPVKDIIYVVLNIMNK